MRHYSMDMILQRVYSPPRCGRVYNILTTRWFSTRRQIEILVSTTAIPASPEHRHPLAKF
jgi:hypothetical protein